MPLIEYIDEWICIMQTTPAKPPKLLDQIREAATPQALQHTNLAAVCPVGA
jgi:hypothetical protein